MSACEGGSCFYGGLCGGPVPCGGCCSCFGGCQVEHEEQWLESQEKDIPELDAARLRAAEGGNQ